MIKIKSQNLFEERLKLENYLKDSGLKFSQGRETVFQEVLGVHGHFSAEDLVKTCRKKDKKVSRATIYRSLRDLLEAGIIRKTAFGEKHEHYEHVYDEQLHHHARCIRCHAVVEFPDLKEDRVYVPLLEQQGFRILGHEMHFYGICKNCIKKEV